MSHFSTVKTELRDLDALRAALGDMGHEPREGSISVRGYRGQTETAELAIAQPDGTDIGFRLNADTGCYELVADLQLWKQPVPVERFLAQLNQRYALRSILAATAEEGFQVSEQTNSADGSIELVVTRWS
ncbi:DUF1257 domain-containing protein [Cyanobium sp. CH-040]|uniref:DUF1257 domain-containing protein n=1 Tax=Cyanobium sp. CH-040 TaxID=2823708 RepID=UPI0020CC7ED3|nr:DUF1257 domain-containing protein [Cyanobium sp. CH-040]MCP9927974.1 DUF1257 domain-containing protein [Cyanobium sp. CH-040]